MFQGKEIISKKQSNVLRERDRWKDVLSRGHKVISQGIGKEIISRWMPIISRT